MLSSERRLISIVDDDEWARQGMSAYIESCGHDCATFRTAEEYLSFDRMCDTICLIADVQLPGMKGPDLQDRLIADGCCIPIIFVTGFFDERIRNRVLRAGAIGYLTKPYREETLSDCLQRALGNFCTD
ncbi:MAG TPA: response regulator [Xanthobacteraceae bacterium]|nr:response regulator [Xanthobacteraceae bacterium]